MIRFSLILSRFLLTSIIIIKFPLKFCSGLGEEGGHDASSAVGQLFDSVSAKAEVNQELCTNVFYLSLRNISSNDDIIAKHGSLDADICMIFTGSLKKYRGKDKFYPKHLYPCSFMVYNYMRHRDVRRIRRSWIYILPGIKDDSFHFFLMRKGAVLVPKTVPNSVTSLMRVYFIVDVTSILMEVSSIDFNGANLIHLGYLAAMTDGKFIHYPKDVLEKYDRSNLYGAKCSLAVPAIGMSPVAQEDFQKLKDHPNLRDFDYAATPPFSKFVLTVDMMIKAVNGTAQVHDVYDFNLGHFDRENKEWYGVVSDVVSGAAHICYGVAMAVETPNYMSATIPVNLDDYSYVVALPEQSSGSILFLFEGFDMVVWIVYVILGVTIIILLAIVNPHKFSVILGAMLKPLIDQSTDEADVRKNFTTSSMHFFVLSPWLITVIVTSSYLKCQFTASLVEPTFIFPPRTMRELASSDYSVGALYYFQTELYITMKDMKNIDYVQELRKKVIPLDFYTVPMCFENLHKSNHACLGLKSIMGPHVRYVKKEKDYKTKRPIIWSSDMLSYRFVIVAISNYVEQITDKFNRRIEVMSENGFDQHWRNILKIDDDYGNNIFKSGKLNLDKSIGEEAFYQPLVLLGIGIAVSFVVFLIECFRNFVKEIMNPPVKRLYPIPMLISVKTITKEDLKALSKNV